MVAQGGRKRRDDKYKEDKERSGGDEDLMYKWWRPSLMGNGENWEERNKGNDSLWIFIMISQKQGLGNNVEFSKEM